MSSFAKDLEKYAKVINGLLRVIGFMPNKVGDVNLRHITCVLFITLLGILTAFIAIYTAWPNIEEIIFNLTPLLASSIVNTKLLYFVISRKQFAKLLLPIKTQFWNLEENSSREEKNAVEDFARYVYYTNVVQSVLICSAATLWLFFPLLQMYLSNENTDGSTTKVLPFLASLPLHLDPYSEPFYEIVYIAQSFLLITTMVTMCAEDCLFIHCVFNTCGQFKLLQIRIRNFYKHDGVTAQKTALNKCIESHQEILLYCEDLENFFSIPMLIQLLEPVLFLCSAGIIITTFEGNTFIYLQSCISIVACSCQLFTHCYAGEILTNESLQVGEAAYDSKWYNAPVSIQKLIFTIIVRSQKPVYVTAANFTPLSVQTYGALNRTAMSYFTVLSSLRE